MMQDIMEDKTIVNFKDIISFISLPPQEEDKDIVLNPQPKIHQSDSFVEENE